MAERSLKVHKSFLQRGQENQARDTDEEELLQDNSIWNQKIADEPAKPPGQYRYKISSGTYQVFKSQNRSSPVLKYQGHKRENESVLKRMPIARYGQV